jgi:hypothetical protein
MARSSMRGAIAAAVVWLMVGADRIVWPEILDRFFQCALDDLRKSWRRSDQTAERALRAGSCGTNERPAAFGRTVGRIADTHALSVRLGSRPKTGKNCNRNSAELAAGRRRTGAPPSCCGQSSYSSRLKARSGAMILSP